MKKIALTLFVFLLLGRVCSQSLNVPMIKKNIVFLGTVQNGVPIVFATASLLRIEDVAHLITSKHVVVELKNGTLTNKVSDNNLMAFIHDKSGKIIIKPIAGIKAKGCDWVFHKDPNVDIAIIPFVVDLKTEDVIFIPEELFLTTKDIYETYNVVYTSFQNQISQLNNLSPIFRTGMISSINADKTFYIDGNAFPGNSGSPVFLRPGEARYNNDGTVDMFFGGDPHAGKFIGIVGEAAIYQETAFSNQTNRPRVTFEENTGLTKIWSVDFIVDIINSPAFKQQISRIKK